MPGTNKFAVPTILFLAVLALSACATKPAQEPVTEPAMEQPAMAEPAPAPAAAVVAEPAPAPAPEMAAEAPAPKPVVKKARRKAKAAAPAAVAPAPVMEPAPATAAAPEPAPVQAATPPAMVETPLAPVAEQGFLQRYWVWLLGIIIAAIAILFMMRKKE